MNSRITIDVDHDNQPVIKIEYSPSDDVRDKLIKKFLESYGGVSAWASFFFINNYNESIHGQNNQVALLRPIPIQNLKDEAVSIKYVADQHEKTLSLVVGPKED